MDKVDREILHLLQQDATLTVTEVADRVGLTITPCWRRIQQLENKGVIRRRVALLDPVKLQLGLTVFVQVKAGRHDASWLTRFAEHAGSMEEVMEFYRMSGEYDYMLKVVVRDMQAFDHFYQRLVAGIELTDVTSSFSMQQIKYTTAMPLDSAGW